MGQYPANVVLLSFKRFSCKGIHENGNAWRERIFALVKAVFVEAQGIFQIICEVLSNEWNYVSGETHKDLI